MRSGVRKVDAALVAVFAALAILTLTPRASDEKHRELVPFRDTRRAFGDPVLLVSVVGNLLVFLPVGFLFALRGTTWLRAIAAGAVFSASIEVLQLAIPGRTTSIDDLLLNTLGTALGWWAGSRLLADR